MSLEPISARKTEEESVRKPRIAIVAYGSMGDIHPVASVVAGMLKSGLADQFEYLKLYAPEELSNSEKIYEGLDFTFPEGMLNPSGVSFIEESSKVAGRTKNPFVVARESFFETQWPILRKMIEDFDKDGPPDLLLINQAAESTIGSVLRELYGENLKIVSLSVMIPNMPKIPAPPSMAVSPIPRLPSNWLQHQIMTFIADHSVYRDVAKRLAHEVNKGSEARVEPKRLLSVRGIWEKNSIGAISLVSRHLYGNENEYWKPTGYTTIPEEILGGGEIPQEAEDFMRRAWEQGRTIVYLDMGSYKELPEIKKLYDYLSLIPQLLVPPEIALMIRAGDADINRDDDLAILNLPSGIPYEKLYERVAEYKGVAIVPPTTGNMHLAMSKGLVVVDLGNGRIPDQISNSSHKEKLGYPTVAINLDELVNSEYPAEIISRAVADARAVFSDPAKMREIEAMKLKMSSEDPHRNFQAVLMGFLGRALRNTSL